MSQILPTIEEQHIQLVSTSFKHIDGRGGNMELLHAILGLAGEVGELVDAVKKHVFYGKPLDIYNVVEEMGDIKYYFEALRQNIAARNMPKINLTERDILSLNLKKLRKRYTGEKFSEVAAIARADKVPVIAETNVQMANKYFAESSHVPGSPEWHEFNEATARDFDKKRNL
jgi:NTP pyrophosphatase (non-canonical NTP hydrolase)